VLNMEQEIRKDLGAFLRASWRDGRSEVWQFTDIDRSLSAGFSLKGTSWNRENDTAGLAYVLDGLGPDSEAYFAAGGLGTLIGDGKLNYGLEQVWETYYSAALTKKLFLTFDFQFVTNPGYNRDRGPIPVFAGRLHFEF
jgi:high affinity Mn2+ porin